MPESSGPTAPSPVRNGHGTRTGSWLRSPYLIWTALCAKLCESFKFKEIASKKWNLGFWGGEVTKLGQDTVEVKCWECLGKKREMEDECGIWNWGFGKMRESAGEKRGWWCDPTVVSGSDERSRWFGVESCGPFEIGISKFLNRGAKRWGCRITDMSLVFWAVYREAPRLDSQVG